MARLICEKTVILQKLPLDEYDQKVLTIFDLRATQIVYKTNLAACDKYICRFSSSGFVLFFSFVFIGIIPEISIHE